MHRRDFVLRAAALVALAGGGVAACSTAGEPERSSSAGTTPTGTDATSPGAGSTTPATDPTAIATQALLAGLPLLVTRRTMQTFAELVGTNTLLRTARLANPTSRLVVAPNNDTTYVLAVLDLRAGPLLLRLPPIPDRYHVLQLLDAWMGGFGLVGTRTDGGVGGTYVLAPTGWQGSPPAGARVLECPTPHGFMLGRIRAVDDADAAVAGAIAREITLEPLDPAATAAGLDPLGAPPGPPQDVATNGAAAFDELGDALLADPPVTAEQRAAIEAAGVLGVGAGRRPSSDPAVADLLASAAADALASLEASKGEGSTRTDGWDVNLGLGTADTDRGVVERAVIARYFWGPVPAEEAVYPRLAVASDGEPTDGSKRYRLRFDAGGLPPVDGFWSVTAYGPDMFLVPNPQGRYAISGDTPGLVVGADGSIELAIQHEAPAGDGANWLPVPAGPFTLIMRLYLPRSAITDGSWTPPPVTVV